MFGARNLGGDIIGWDPYTYMAELVRVNSPGANEEELRVLPMLVIQEGERHLVKA